MIPIDKKEEPRYLTEYKKKDPASFDGLDKNIIRRSLLEEQGYI